MKTISLKILVLSGALALSGPVFAADFNIEWFAIDGGGGTSTGGDYALAGSIGPMDAAMMAGGDYGLVSGFLVIVATIEPPSPPRLNITLNALKGEVSIEWPDP